MSDFHNFKVGDGVHWSMGTDRYPGTVIAVSESGKTVTVQEDDAVLENQDGLGVLGNQRYKFERNEQGIIHVFRRSRQDNRFYANGRSCRLGLEQSAYYDPHF